jgi:hypothetical protein
VAQAGLQLSKFIDGGRRGNLLGKYCRERADNGYDGRQQACKSVHLATPPIL